MVRRLVQFKLISLLLIFASQSIMANNAIEIEKKLLTGIFPTSCHFSGQFLQQKHIQGIPMPLKSDGNFFFSCDLGLVWRTKSPFEEALLYINAATSFRANDESQVEPLSGMVHYSMSKIFLKLLKADTNYFANKFSVQLTGEDKVTELIPESSSIKKGIEWIRIKKNQNDESVISLNIHIKDTSGQITQVDIGHINEHVIEGKREAFNQCEKLYPKPLEWCKVLRFPWHYEES